MSTSSSATAAAAAAALREGVVPRGNAGNDFRRGRSDDGADDKVEARRKERRLRAGALMLDWESALVLDFDDGFEI